MFAERGYAGASVELIAENAGFSIGASYSNFATKANVFVALMSEQTRDRFATVAGPPEELVPHLASCCATPPITTWRRPSSARSSGSTRCAIPATPT